MIELGSIVKDKLTGLKGVATGRTEWQYGCTRYCVEPQELKDGKPIEGTWFDEQRLEVVKPDKPEGVKRGGPQNDPPSRTSRP